ncbi:MAG: hypothetical protein KME25_02925 [Symplocastrum torsivum CPER-KK1]|uniref:Uncharacterized protein n=1 Tax=Symplocastrum torsivum CPER-KK1 TaxID=450513 RepID=A0A951PHW5_9CYAN|nr:hypothetical protein [Symplocastrum torsivum CPER-KK1]
MEEEGVQESWQDVENFPSLCAFSKGGKPYGLAAVPQMPPILLVSSIC